MVDVTPNVTVKLAPESWRRCQCCFSADDLRHVSVGATYAGSGVHVSTIAICGSCCVLLRDAITRSLDGAA